MTNVVVQLPADLSGTNPNNLSGNEEHLLVNYDGFPYKILTLFHGGFYAASLKVFDQDYKKLLPGIDFIATYKHQGISDRTGFDVCSAIIFLNKARTGIVYTSAQMVGSDLAFSFNVIQDYINFYKSKPAFVPSNNDFVGTEPTWGPGELVQNRWHLDTYQPLNNEMENIARRTMVGPEGKEDTFRQSVRDRLTVFLARFNTRLDQHIANKANPHQVNKTDLGLPLLRNLQVATGVIAQAGVSNDHYMTPALVWSEVQKLAMEPLAAHVNLNPANAHWLTNVQLNAPNRYNVDTDVGRKYNLYETVANATYCYLRGAWTTYDGYVWDLRHNLDTSFFPNGMLEPWRMGTGPLSATSIYRGNGTWVEIDQLFAEYGSSAGGIGTVRTMAPVGNDIWATLAQIRSWYPSDPDGSLVFVNFTQHVQQGFGNGSVSYEQSNRATYIKVFGSWTYV